VNKPTEIMLHETKLDTPEESIADLVRKMLAVIGEDPNREGLRKTPERCCGCAPVSASRRR
jgi:GTP cyclohydrolase I